MYDMAMGVDYHSDPGLRRRVAPHTTTNGFDHGNYGYAHESFDS